MTPIAFLNPGAQTAPLREELLRAVTAVIDAGHFILGPNVAALEQEVATFCGAAHGIGVNSGSDALTLALKALDIGPGDEVITTPFTYIAPAESIHQLGAKVVFADIDPRTFTLDPADVAQLCLQAIRDEQFLILPHPEVATYVERKATDRDRWLAGMRRFQSALHPDGNLPGDAIAP